MIHVYVINICHSHLENFLISSQIFYVSIYEYVDQMFLYTVLYPYYACADPSL